MGLDDGVERVRLGGWGSNFERGKDERKREKR